MSLDFYNAKLKNAPASCYDYYMDHMQALINDRWDNTTSLLTIKEEEPFGSFEFRDIEVHIIHALDKTTGKKQGDDFREIVFKDLNRTVELGSCYYFDDNYWLSINLDEENRVSKNIFNRRCNNVLRYRDSEDGHIVEIPCILDYDATSPQQQVDNDIITPNNKIQIIVQGNEKTHKFIQNYRFIFTDRVFKITGFNNYMWESNLDRNAPLLYLDAYLDEKSPYDDFENGVAYNEELNYSLTLDTSSINQIKGYSTQLTANVLLNNNIVQRTVNWYSSNKNVVSVNEEGVIVLVGNVGEQATITAQLGENTEVISTVEVTIVENAVDSYEIRLTPFVEQVRQNQTIQFRADLYKNNVKQNIIIDLQASGANIEAYDIEILGDNTFNLKCNNISKIPLLLKFDAQVYQQNFMIRLVSMF